MYYEDKVWEPGMPTFDELSHVTKGYLLDSLCYVIFVKSQRAADLQLEMLDKMN